MRQLDETSMKMLLVTDYEKHLLGIVSDGDIRRAMLHGQTMGSKLNNAMNRNPIVAKSESEAKRLGHQPELRSYNYIPIVDDNNIVTGLSPVNTLSKRNAATVVLMLGGKGVRLRPLTIDCPKPMLKIGDLPILERNLLTLIGQGFTEFYMCVNYLASQIIDHFGDGGKFGVNIRYVQEEKTMGTAGALSLLDLPDEGTKPFLLINGDLLTDMNFVDLVDHHIKCDSAITSCVIERHQPIAYGVVSHQEGLITKVEEKPSIAIDILGGIYCISYDQVKKINHIGYLDMPDLLSRAVESGEKCCTYKLNGFWMDVGSHDDLKRAREIYAKMPDFNVDSS